MSFLAIVAAVAIVAIVVLVTTGRYASESVASDNALVASGLAGQAVRPSQPINPREVPVVVPLPPANFQYFKFQKQNDRLALNELLGGVVPVVGGNDMDMLRSGIAIQGNGRRVTYNQQLLFGQDTGSTGKVVFDKNRDLIVDDYLWFDNNYKMFTYKLSFVNELVGIRNFDGKINDTTGTTFSALGDTFYIAKAIENSNTVNLKLTDGMNIDFDEGQTRTVTTGGVDYEITCVFVSQTSAKFIVNGEVTGELFEGDTDYLSSRIPITVLKVTEPNPPQGHARVAFGKQVVVLVDVNFLDDQFYEGYSVNGDIIEEAMVQIIGHKAGNQVFISSVSYYLKANARVGADVFVPADGFLSQQIDWPAGILGGLWDIQYRAPDNVQSTPISLDPAGDDAYYLTFKNSVDRWYHVPFIDTSGQFKYGDDSSSLWFQESQNYQTPQVNENDKFVLTAAGDTSVLRFDSVDTYNQKVLFTDLAGGTKEASYQGSPWSGDLVIGGETFKFYVYGNEQEGYMLSMDLDGNGLIYGAEVNIVVKGGGKIDLGTNGNGFITTSPFNLVLNTSRLKIEESVRDELINIQFTDMGSTVELALFSQLEVSLKTGNNVPPNRAWGLSQYGVFVDLYIPQPAALNMTYPATQKFYNAYIKGPRIPGGQSPMFIKTTELVIQE